MSQAYREAAGGGHFLRHHRLVRSPTAAPPSTSTRSDTLLNDPSATTVFEVIADQDVLIGNEVSEDFGDASNYVYIHHHGFLPPYNPFDCVDIPLPTMMNRPVGLQYADALSSFSAWIASWASPAVDKRELFASQEQYNALLNVLQFKPGSVPVACLRVEPLPRDIRHLFQVRYASSHLVETCLEKVKQQPGRKSSPGFDEIEELRSKCLDHVPMPTAAWEELASIAQAVLDAFPTTEENDSQLLRLGSLPCKKMGPAKAGASSGLTPDGAAEVCNPLFFQLTNNEM